MSAQRHQATAAYERDLADMVRDELARRAYGELWAEFQEWDEAHSDEHGNASAHDWAVHLQDAEHPIWLDALREARDHYSGQEWR